MNVELPLSEAQSETKSNYGMLGQSLKSLAEANSIAF